MILNLKTDEPCDVYLVANSQKRSLTAVVCESRDVYQRLLQTDYEGPDVSLLCSKHEFLHRQLQVVVSEDLGLVDGASCYEVVLPDHVKELIDTCTI